MNLDLDIKALVGFAVLFVPGSLVRTWGTRPISSERGGGVQLGRTEVRYLEDGGSDKKNLRHHTSSQTGVTWTGAHVRTSVRGLKMFFSNAFTRGGN